MGTTRDDIRGWFNRGVDQQADFMIVVCDTFDYEDFPKFCKSADFDECEKQATNGMGRIMEVYDLSMDREEQLSQRRVFNRPKVQSNG